MRLPVVWESFLAKFLDVESFYIDLESLLHNKVQVMPERSLIFNVFNFMKPEEVTCVLYGEDPYPRYTSANGIAFWDNEIKRWNDKTNGNSLKNILKAILVDKQLADYSTNIEQCRIIAKREKLISPEEMFELWLNQGVLLVNSAMTFSGKDDKIQHFLFWKPFHKALIKSLNVRNKSPFYILWGNKARKWENDILPSIDDPGKIIRQGHPTFIHQFLDKDNPGYSPFVEINKKTGIRWI